MSTTLSPGLIAHTINRFHPTHVHTLDGCAGCERPFNSNRPSVRLGLYINTDTGLRVVYPLCSKCSTQLDVGDPALAERIAAYLEVVKQLTDNHHHDGAAQA